MKNSVLSFSSQSDSLDLLRDGSKSVTEGTLQDELTLIRYLQEVQDADIPSGPTQPQFHTGKLPNSRANDGKPRLLLMGQRRSVHLSAQHAYLWTGR